MTYCYEYEQVVDYLLTHETLATDTDENGNWSNDIKLKWKVWETDNHKFKIGLEIRIPIEQFKDELNLITTKYNLLVIDTYPDEEYPSFNAVINDIGL